MRDRAQLVRVVLSIVVASTLVFSCSAQDHRPDSAIFLVVVDTLRADRLSSYGYAKHLTPSIDRLAKLGLRFDQAHSAASWTVPSMASMLTSLYPTELGLAEIPAEPGRRFKRRERRKQNSGGPPQHAEMLAEILGREGFTTAAFVNQPMLNVSRGFSRRFDDWYYPVSLEQLKRHDPEARWPGQNWKGTHRHAGRVDTTLAQTFENWLSEHGRERLFVWLHLLEPHRPYNTRQTMSEVDRRKQSRSERYDDEILAVDRTVGEIIASIDRHVGLEHATVIFVSDHGEEFSEHGSVEHGHSLHREVTRVPLIIVSPSLPSDEHFDAHVSSVDIMPTILQLTGLEERTSEDIRGESLVGMYESHARKQPLYAEGMLYWRYEAQLDRANGHKLIYSAQDENLALYDLSADPGEKTNLVSSKRSRMSALKTRLDQIHRQIEERWQVLSGDSAPANDQEDEAMLRALKAIGYVE